jgi:hypothetical protein
MKYAIILAYFKRKEVVMNKAFIVNYKEVELDDSNVQQFESGVCDIAYSNEDDAKEKMWELSDDKMNDLLDKFDSEEVFRDSHGDNADYLTVVSPIGTYEYFITIVEIV